MGEINIQELYDLYRRSAGISTDSREILPDSIFFALKGPNYNANEFAEEALDKGASRAVIDEEKFKKGEAFILVKDALKTLQQLANFHRHQFSIPFLAITGSNGKTTTKELIREMLSRKFKVKATAGNLNNQIGVPLTLLSIPDDTEIAVIEMGANHIGEIRSLCKISEPTHGLITNIGKAHTEGFGSFEGVLRGKTELYDYLIKNNGKVFINSRNKYLKNMIKRFDDPILYPEKGNFYHCEFIQAKPFVELKTEEGELIKTNLIGKYNFENIATALCAGKFFGVGPEERNKAASNYQPLENRSQVIRSESNTIILDAYNANPDSMEAALENFKSMEGENKVLILGDMNELGNVSDEEHLKLVQKTKDPAFMKVLLCGKLIKKASSQNTDSQWFEDSELLAEFLKEHPVENSLILIKASRSIGLEKIVDSL